MTTTTTTTIDRINPLGDHTMAIVRAKFTPTRLDELGCTLGERLRIVNIYADDWALCVNDSGEEGIVPLTCLDRGPGKFSEDEGGAAIGVAY